MLNVIEEIYGQFLKEDKPRERKPRHYPSGICAVQEGNFVGKCRRALFYDWFNFPKSNPIEPVAWFKMEMGNLIHDFLDGIMNKALAGKKYAVVDSDLCGDEKPIIWQHPGLKYPFSMRVDKIFELEGKRYACEWKSSYGFGIQQVQKNGIKDDNLLQTMIYLEQDQIKIDGIFLVYVARDSGFLYGFIIEKDPAGGFSIWHMNSNTYSHADWNMDGIVAPVSILEDYIEDETLPERDYECRVVTSRDGQNYLDPKGDWHCRYCGFASMCYGFVKTPSMAEVKKLAAERVQKAEEEAKKAEGALR